MSERTPPERRAADPVAELLAAGDAEGAAAHALATAGDERPWVRERALASVPRLRNARLLLPALESALRDGGDAGRRNAARSLLAAMSAPGALPGALRMLDRLTRHDPDGDVRLLAASALGESENPGARAALEAALVDDDANVAAAAADALGSLGDPRSVDALAAVTAGGDPWRALAAVFALGRIGAARALPALAAAVADPMLAGAAVEAIGELGDPAAMDALRAAAEMEDEELRAAVLQAAAGLLPSSPPPPPEWLREAARADEARLAEQFAADESGDSRAAVLLGVAGTSASAAALADALGEPERGPAAAGALGLLPPDVALAVLLPRLRGADAGARAELLAALPALPDRASAESVAALLGDEDAEVRATAAESLARALPAAEAREVVAGALADPARRAGAALALGRFPVDACDLLLPLLEDETADTRRAAAEGIARCSRPDALSLVAAALRRERDPSTLRALAAALATTGGADAVPPLAELAEGGDPGARFAAVRALGRTGAPEAVDALLRVLGGTDDPGVEAAALAALGELGDPRGTEAVTARMESADRDLRRVAAIALRQIAPPGAAERLVRALGDPDWRVRLAAARTLARVDAPEALPALRDVRACDPDPLVRQAAARALGEG